MKWKSDLFNNIVRMGIYLLLKMRIMEMAHLTDIQTAKVGIVLLLLQIGRAHV